MTESSIGKLTDAQAESRGEGNREFATQAISDLELTLMSRIHTRWSADIITATHASSVSPAFLAALTANESGGDPAARAFEPEVYRSLRAVITGEAPSYGGIVAQDLFSAFAENFRPPTHAREEAPQATAEIRLPLHTLTAGQEDALKQMATSWGLTQIMGYQILGRKKTVQDLLNPLLHFQYAVSLLEELGRRFALDLSNDFTSLFQCWNSGHPGGKTFDPQYVPRGMQRMTLYEELESAPTSLSADRSNGDNESSSHPVLATPADAKQPDFRIGRDAADGLRSSPANYLKPGGSGERSA